MGNFEKKELLKAVESGDVFGFGWWYNDLCGMLRHFTRMNDTPVDPLDYGLEFALAYQKARNKFDPNNGYAFNHYLMTALKFELFKRWAKEKSGIKYILESELNTPEGTDSVIESVNGENDPEYNDLQSICYRELSPREAVMLSMRSDGYRLKEIAEKIGLRYMYVNNMAWPKLRNKLKKRLTKIIDVK